MEREDEESWESWLEHMLSENLWLMNDDHILTFIIDILVSQLNNIYIEVARRLANARARAQLSHVICQNKRWLKQR